MITIYTMTWNEELLLQFMIDHYRSRFPSCKIIVRDNESTDASVAIAKANGCEVISYCTDNQHDDIKLRELKNNCWKNADTDWVLVCDPDELLNITEQELKNEDLTGTTIIKSEGYNMINLENNSNLSSIKWGERFTAYDKAYLFKKSAITDINYECGAHSYHPCGTVKLSIKPYILYHYKFINPDYIVDRFKMTAKRLSQNNLRHGMGSYTLESEDAIRKEFERRKKDIIRIIP